MSAGGGRWNGKENGNYRDCRGYIGFRVGMKEWKRQWKLL